MCAQHPGAREEPIRLREEGASPTLSTPPEEEEEEEEGRKEDTHSNGVRQNSWCMIYQHNYAYSDSFITMIFLYPQLLTGRCYEAEILLPLRYAFAWLPYPFLPKSKFSVSDQKPWTIYSQAF